MKTISSFACGFIIFILNISVFAATLSSISGQSALDSETVKRSAEGKKGLVVVFLSAQCPCSNSHVPEMRDLAKEFKDFEFVAVNSNPEDSAETAKTYFSSLNLGFPIIKDKKTELADAFSAKRTPHAFVVAPDGKILFKGGVSSSRQFVEAEHKYLRAALNEINSGITVTEPDVRVVGCSISR